jgi:hypothetical protein
VPLLEVWWFWGGVVVCIVLLVGWLAWYGNDQRPPP